MSWRNFITCIIIMLLFVPNGFAGQSRRHKGGDLHKILRDIKERSVFDDTLAAGFISNYFWGQLMSPKVEAAWDIALTAKLKEISVVPAEATDLERNVAWLHTAATWALSPGDYFTETAAELNPERMAEVQAAMPHYRGLVEQLLEQRETTLKKTYKKSKFYAFIVGAFATMASVIIINPLLWVILMILPFLWHQQRKFLWVGGSFCVILSSIMADTEYFISPYFAFMPFIIFMLYVLAVYAVKHQQIIESAVEQLKPAVEQRLSLSLQYAKENYKFVIGIALAVLVIMLLFVIIGELQGRQPNFY